VAEGNHRIGLVVALVYWALRRLLDLVVLCVRAECSKELEIRVPRTQRGESRLMLALPGCGAVQEMEVGPPESPCRGRLQTCVTNAEGGVM
jgi:hypothetical protein